MVIEILKWNVHEKKIKEYFKDKKYNVAIDIGASDGQWSYFLSQISEKVYAFEPNKKLYNILIKNMEELGLLNKKVFCYNIALSSIKGKTRFYDKETLVHSSIVDDKHKEVKTKDTYDVETETIDNLFNNIKVDFIKIDTEGHEYNVLLGAYEVLKRDKPNLCIEIHNNITKNTFYDELCRILNVIVDVYSEKPYNSYVMTKKVIIDWYGDNNYIIII